MNVMATDPTVQVAALGIVATLISSITIIIVTRLNNSKEREAAADEGVESTLRERVAFGEAQVEALEKRLDRKDAIILQQTETIVRLGERVDTLEEENDRLKAELREKNL